MNVYETKTPTELLKGNPYVGRGIVVGKTPDGKKAVSAYFIMGRSENSRNRVFEKVDGKIITKAFDESKLEDPSLIIYNAVREYENKLIVTNGDQTDTIYDFIKRDGKGFAQALNTREFEPDGPNWTPRISAMLKFENNDFSYRMSILKSADEKGSACSRFYFSYPALSGIGHFIHTYVTDGNPIPTFQGEPERMKMNDDIKAFTNEVWENLDENNKISLYVRYTDIESGKIEEEIINKNN